MSVSLALGGAPVRADARVDEPASLAARFAAAWNAHDAEAFASLLAPDADWVTASGQRLRGRAAITDFLAEEHRTWAKATTMRARNVHSRRLDESTVIVMFEWEIETPGEAGAAPTVARGNNLFVTRRDDGWLVIAGQVARIRPR
jgi:uncharacterized protein (TIGR02246 family)